MAAFVGAFVAAIASVAAWQAESHVPARTHVVARRVALPAAPRIVLAPSPSPSQIAPAPVPSPAVAGVSAAPATTAPPTPARTPPPAPPAPPAIVVGSYQQRLINEDRAANGLAPLTWSSCLAGVAAQNAGRMAGQGYVSHANGISADLGCGLGGFAGENLGYWTGGVNDVQLNAMFMNSSEHRANILNSTFRYVGTAWATAPNGTAYLAVEFET
ncbi:MAG TPA: CAP domain-containing protein [Candidatus Dormibacteraeota bacterium]